MKITKFIIILLLSAMNSVLNSYNHRFINNTAEVLDVEVDVAWAGYGLREKIQPGETRDFSSPGAHCINGINIWRTYYPRDWTGLLGTWKFGGSHDPVFEGIAGEYSKGGTVCSGNQWTISYSEKSPLQLLREDKKFQNLSQHDQLETIKRKLQENDSKLLKEGAGYILIHDNGDPGTFLQGSNAAWTERFKGNLNLT